MCGMTINAKIRFSSFFAGNCNLNFTKAISTAITSKKSGWAGPQTRGIKHCLSGISDKNCVRNFASKTQDKMAELTLTRPVEANVFRFSDYDCIGFDLDNTICRYKLGEMVKLEYDVLAEYLVSEKGYDANYLLRPLQDNVDFLQKGLLLDFFQGNVLQLRYDGAILRASHGTRFMNDSEIKEIYGDDKKWESSVAFTKNMLEYWNGPLEERIRTVSDYFDMPSALAFARIVDSLDAKKGKQADLYNIWPDILDGLYHMFKREHFSLNIGGYFSALKANPDKYIHKCSNNVINWFKQIKSSKTTFLVTGSNVDFASFTASNSLGDNWRSLFDIVVCYARKPGFFTGARPFLKIDGMNEKDPIDGKDLEPGNIYSQGNWQELYQFLAKQTGVSQPKTVYVGDNLIQDVYVPSEYTKCDSVAVVEELCAEGMNGSDIFPHVDTPILTSSNWGSYFGNKQKEIYENSFWNYIIRKHAKICVPDLDVLANLPLSHEFKTFCEGEGMSDVLGYYPGCPLELSQQAVVQNP